MCHSVVINSPTLVTFAGSSKTGGGDGDTGGLGEAPGLGDTAGDGTTVVVSAETLYTDKASGPPHV